MARRRIVARRVEAALRDKILSVLQDGAILRLRPTSGTGQQFVDTIWRIYHRQVRDTGEVAFTGRTLSVTADPTTPGTVILSRKENTK